MEYRKFPISKRFEGHAGIALAASDSSPDWMDVEHSKRVWKSQNESLDSLLIANVFAFENPQQFDLVYRVLTVMEANLCLGEAKEALGRFEAP
jgi:hypothetical protein